jgi:hypothetical protein
MEAAEDVISEQQSSYKSRSLHRVCLPVIEIVCFHGAESIKIDSYEDPAYELYNHIVGLMERVIIPEEVIDDVTKKFRLFKALVEESVQLETEEKRARWFHRSIFGLEDDYDEAISAVESDNVFGTDNIDGESYLMFQERTELANCYKERIDHSQSREELQSVLEEIINDECFNMHWKKTTLYGKIVDLGFDPYLSQYKRLSKFDDTMALDEDSPFYECLINRYDGKSREEYYGELIQSCQKRDSQQVAKIISDRLMSLLEHETTSDESADRYIFQAQIIACMVGDEKSAKKYTKDYFQHIALDLEYKCSYIVDNIETLRALNKSDEANAFIMRGIEVLGSEAGTPQITEESKYDIYVVLETLAGCIGDTQLGEQFKEVQKELLGLGFMYTDPDAVV